MIHMRKTLYLAATITVLLLLSACSASRLEEPAIIEPASSNEAVISSEEMAAPSSQGDQSEEMAPESADTTMKSERPAWQQLALTNVDTGEMFTLADFAGKTIFVEPMATWCSNCRRQLTNVRDAKQQLLSDDVVFVALSVETNLENADLAIYADQAGFDWLFAVATPELLRQLADTFGQSITNPPATPHFIIRADGSSTELITGIESSSQILSQITAAQGQMGS